MQQCVWPSWRYATVWWEHASRCHAIGAARDSPGGCAANQTMSNVRFGFAYEVADLPDGNSSDRWRRQFTQSAQA